MQNIFKKRISKILALLKQQNSDSALLISSAAIIPKSRDSNYRFFQNRDFYYLTGLEIPDLVLLASGKQNRVWLFAAPENQETIIWEGARPNLKKLAQSIAAELVITNDIQNEALTRIKNHETLFFTNLVNSLAWRIAEPIITLPSHISRSMPRIFKFSDLLIEPLRIIKDEQEIKLIKQAATITLLALQEVKELIIAGTSEADIAAALAYVFKSLDAEEAFSSIVATGRSAATLHYHAHNKTLKNKDLLLLDFGASYKNYASDVTRVFPVNGVFESWQSELYEVVLSAQKAAISKIRAGVLVQKIYDAAAKELTIGLKELGVLKGNVAALFKKQAYKKYFPHGIGHTLGLDVHDVGNLRGNNHASLKSGMVITIEPGLYFPKPAGRLPACGVRIEDNFLVTNKGSHCLTANIPKELLEVEQFLLKG